MNNINCCYTLLYGFTEILYHYTNLYSVSVNTLLLQMIDLHLPSIVLIYSPEQISVVAEGEEVVPEIFKADVSSFLGDYPRKKLRGGQIPLMCFSPISVSRIQVSSCLGKSFIL